MGQVTGALGPPSLSRREEEQEARAPSSHPHCPLSDLADHGAGRKDHPAGVSAKFFALSFNSVVGTLDDATKFSSHSGEIGTIIIPIL